MKRTASNVLSVIPKISEVALLLCTHIFFSGVIGYVLFSRKAIGIGKNPNFESLESSFYSLFILLTTTNFPDVMIPSYNAQNWTALFFVAYLVFGLFFLMNLVLAVVVSSFKRSTREVCEEVIKNQCSALAAAFNELADSTPHTPDKVVTAESWMSMMRFYRPGVSDRHSLVIFRALDVHGNCYLTLSEWRRIPEFVDVKIVGDTDLQDQILFERKLRSMSGSKIFLAVVGLPASFLCGSARSSSHSSFSSRTPQVLPQASGLSAAPLCRDFL
jgi:two pore calcium channel protein 1